MSPLASQELSPHPLGNGPRLRLSTLVRSKSVSAICVDLDRPSLTQSRSLVFNQFSGLLPDSIGNLTFMENRKSTPTAE